MSFDTNIFSDKLKKLMGQYEIIHKDIISKTNISDSRLNGLLSGKAIPTGDEVLIFSDFFNTDYNYFISNERYTLLDQSETLFRKYKNSLSKEDKWNILEFLYLCEAESNLNNLLSEQTKADPKYKFSYTPPKYLTNHKEQGIQASKALRDYLKLEPLRPHQDVFSLFRSFGFHIFRRKLSNSKIAGILIRNEILGNCILINYSEDIYRQRFSLLHEIGHVFLDTNQQINLSFLNDGKDFVETRANNFAAKFLVPLDFLQKLKESKGIKNNEYATFSSDEFLTLANSLMVNPEVLAISMNDFKLISSSQKLEFSSLKIQKELKKDPELPSDLTTKLLTSRIHLLENGLSRHYINICLEAYQNNKISRNKLSDILLVDNFELEDILRSFNLILP